MFLKSFDLSELKTIYLEVRVLQNIYQDQIKLSFASLMKCYSPQGISKTSKYENRNTSSSASDKQI